MVGSMKTISTHDAKTHLSRYLAEVEKGERFNIARGKRVVAMLVPAKPARKRPRPKVGKIKGQPFEFPISALAPLTPEELKRWGL
jgi:antitoxin (DNA-binding transcriptional repressor) of toxin-antitoxin stability system